MSWTTLTPMVKICLGIFCLVAFACTPVPSVKPVPRPDSNALVEAHKEKDATIVASANTIDDIAEAQAPQVAEPIREQTDTIRRAVEAHPAEDISKLAAEWNRAMDEMQRALDAERKRADRAEDRAHKLETAEARAQARDLRITAGILLLIAGALTWGKQIGFAAIAALGAVVCFGLAQLVSQSWFMPACAVAVGLGVLALIIAAVHAYRKGTLAAKTKHEAEKLGGVLREIVPVLDDAYDDAEQAVKDLLDRTVFARLKDAMTPEQRAAIHEIRADQSIQT